MAPPAGTYFCLVPAINIRVARTVTLLYDAAWLKLQFRPMVSELVQLYERLVRLLSLYALKPTQSSYGQPFPFVPSPSRTRIQNISPSHFIFTHRPIYDLWNGRVCRARESLKLQKIRYSTAFWTRWTLLLTLLLFLPSLIPNDSLLSSPQPDLLV